MPKLHSSSKTRQFIIGPSTSGNYPTNAVQTSKYTKLNFLPKAIILQFRRLANIYFLITAILQCIDVISSLSPFSAIAPFVLVIALSIIREAIEDTPRQRSDKQVNASIAQTLDEEGQISPKKWSKLKVGELVLIKALEQFPADIALLKSSNENGLAFIETANLDGEKNMKPKYALQETTAYFKGQKVKKSSLYKCSVYAQAPDPSLYKFEGAFIDEEGSKYALSSKQLLLRGSKLQNVEWIIGVVVYTGNDTKVMKNADKSKTKQSRVEALMNKLIVVILMAQMLFCMAAAVGNRVWNEFNLQEHWYLPKKITPNLDGFYTYLSYFLLTNTMIPISLIVTIEIVKFVQAMLIQFDESMYSHEKEKGPQVFCSSINEELGLVDYVFSDKTGTLTTNEMIFKNFVIGKEVYGHEKPKVFTLKDVGEEVQAIKTHVHDEESMANRDKIVDPRLHRLLDSDTSDKIDFTIEEGSGKASLTLKTHKDLVMEFLQAVATCHECLAEKDKGGNITYQGQSQDEIRLVETASDAGFKYLGGGLEKIQMKVLNATKEFKVLQTFEFNSDRKRMSILLRDGATIKLYIKGADNVIMDRLRKNVKQPYLDVVNRKLEEFSKQGYRTLVYAMRTVSENEYKKLKENLDDVAAAVDREERIAQIAHNFERDLYLIGCSSVEDKLQDNVPKVIQDLLSADIKVWMLTGDKLETAENISYSCSLIRGDMSLMRLTGKSHESVRKKLHENHDIYELCVKENRKKAFLVEGEALSFVLSDSELKELFITIILACDAVVCCRVAPKQKAEMVRIVRMRTNKVTLAIGDGANDVNMIQAANIGIGVYGHEGVQAVQASDFSIPEFQNLWRLLLVHGRWSYLRIAEMILYFFFKNMLFTLPQFFYAFFNGYSAETIYEDLYVTTFNLIFTALPLLIKAILEKDVDYRSRNKNNTGKNQKAYSENSKIKAFMPVLYAENKKNLIFTPKNFAYWVFKAAIMSVALFLFAIYGIANQTNNSDGMSVGLWSMSISLYTAVILVVTVKLATHTRYWNIVFVGCLVFLSLAIYFGFTLIYDMFTSSKASYTVGMNYTSVIFYAYIVFFVGLELLLDLTIEQLRKQYKPTCSDVIRQHKKNKKSLTIGTKNHQAVEMVNSFRSELIPAKDGKEVPLTPDTGVPKSSRLNAAINRV